MNNISVIDNFYINPEQIISKLTGEYPISGCGTGNRSIGLQEIDGQLYNDIKVALCSIHNLDPQRHRLTSFFMEHDYDPDSPFNKGWTHIDGKNPDVCRMTVEDYKLVVCGQVFLTKNPDPETGMYICDLKQGLNWTTQELIDRTINDYTLPKEQYLAGQITREEYERQYIEYHDNFVVTCEVKNVYNRLLSWKAGTLHGTKQQTSPSMPNKLNQLFFIESL